MAKVLIVGGCGSVNFIAHELACTFSTTSVKMNEPTPTYTDSDLASQLLEHDIYIKSISCDDNFISDERFKSRVGWYCKLKEPLKSNCFKMKSKHIVRSCPRFNNKQSKQRR